MNDVFSDFLSGFEYNKSLKASLNCQIKQKLAGTVNEVKLIKKKITDKEAQITAVEEKYLMDNISKEIYENLSKNTKPNYLL